MGLDYNSEKKLNPFLVSLAKVQSMNLVEVVSKKLEQEWIEFPVDLYKTDPLYIRPIDQEVRDVFNPDANKVFRKEKTEVVRWILKNDSGKAIGRIAAFINGKTLGAEDQPTGGCGFFDCIDDQNAANKLLDAAKKWLEERGMEAMDGPINLGERDKNWGMLIDGFAEQNYGMNYNAPYYRSLFENYGFQLYFNQFTYGRSYDPNVKFTDRFYEKANITLNDPDYEYRHLTRKEYSKGPEYFLEIYNKAWGGHAGVKPMNLAQAKKMFVKLKPIADLRLLWFGFHKGTPICFFLQIPELNQLYKHVNGKMDWWGKLKFFYHLKTGSCKKSLGIVFGVVPEFHGQGIESALVVAYSKLAWGKGLPYQNIEMNWIGDFNPKMMRVCEQLGAEIWRTHATFRYLFDREKEFKRCPIIG